MSGVGTEKHVEDQPTGRRRHRRVWAVCGVLSLGAIVFVGLQMGLERDEGCYLTPPGYLEQRVVSVERHLLWNTCVLDPGNGEENYEVRSPWQQVHSE